MERGFLNNNKTSQRIVKRESVSSDPARANSQSNQTQKKEPTGTQRRTYFIFQTVLKPQKKNAYFLCAVRSCDDVNFINRDREIRGRHTFYICFAYRVCTSSPCLHTLPNYPVYCATTGPASSTSSWFPFPARHHIQTVRHTTAAHSVRKNLGSHFVWDTLLHANLGGRDFARVRHIAPTPP